MVYINTRSTLRPGRATKVSRVVHAGVLRALAWIGLGGRRGGSYHGDEKEGEDGGEG